MERLGAVGVPQAKQGVVLSLRLGAAALGERESLFWRWRRSLPDYSMLLPV